MDYRKYFPCYCIYVSVSTSFDDLYRALLLMKTFFAYFSYSLARLSYSFAYFSTYGGFWLSAGFLFSPEQGIAAAITSNDYNKGFGIYIACIAAMNLSK